MSITALQIIIFIQALLAMLGSLYFSNFGDPLQGLFSGTGFEPCHLCRWARILMFPLVAIAAYTLFTKEKKIAYLTGAFGLAGMLLTAYHYTIQHKNSLNIFSCGAGNDCTLMGRHIGFVTIPFLAFTAFTIISICSIRILCKKK